MDMAPFQDEPEIQARVLQHLRSKGLRECHVCRQPLWRGDEEKIGFGVGRDFALLHHEDNTEYTRFVPVICSNCGYTLWFNSYYLPGRKP